MDLSKSPVVACPDCGGELPPRVLNRNGFLPCPRCGAAIQAFLFPAALRERTLARPAAVMDGQEGSCFYHPQKRAIVPCSHCGRFLCALCDVEVRDEHLCPLCLEAGVVDAAARPKPFVRYDSLALILAILPAITIWLTFFTAPLAFYYVLRYWNRPVSILPRGRWRFAVAGLLAVAQMVAWAVFFVGLAMDGIGIGVV